MRIVIELVRPFVWLFCRIFFRIEFHGVENIPAEGACIITPNHVTYVDPLWVSIPVKRRIHYMAWDRLFEIPVMGFIMRKFGAFPLKLESIDSKAQRRAAELMRRGGALVIFPEGGRSKTGRIMAFKMGAFRLALVHGATIVPVTIHGGYAIWPVGRLLPRPGRVTVTYHPPLPVERARADLPRAELKDMVRSLARRTREVAASVPPGSEEDADETSTISVGSNA